MWSYKGNFFPFNVAVENDPSQKNNEKQYALPHTPLLFIAPASSEMGLGDEIKERGIDNKSMPAINPLPDIPVTGGQRGKKFATTASQPPHTSHPGGRFMAMTGRAGYCENIA